MRPIFVALKSRGGRAQARRAFPVVARELGLQVQDDEGGGFGKLVGEYGGYQVRVEPEEGARILLLASTPFVVDLRNYPGWKRAHPGFESFFFGDRTLDRWLVSRHCRTEMTDSLIADKPLIRLLSAFMFQPKLQQLTVSEQRIEVRFDVGSPPYLSGGMVRDMVPRLVALARGLDALRTGLELQPEALNGGADA